MNVENALAANIQEVRGSLVAFQEETRESFCQVADHFTKVDARLDSLQEGVATLHAELARVENNMVNGFTALFQHFGVALPDGFFQ